MNTDTAVAELTKIQSWPSVALVLALGVMIGYVLTFWPQCPNRYIPIIILGFCGAAMVVLSILEPAPLKVPLYVISFRNFLIGMIIGFISIIAHKLIMSKITTWTGINFSESSGPKKEEDSVKVSDEKDTAIIKKLNQEVP